MTATTVSLPSDVHGYGALGSRPAAGVAGRQYQDSSTKSIYRDNGTSWDDVTPPGGFTNPMTTKGDLIVGDTAGSPIRKTVGSDGQVLTADAASTGGVKWAAAGGGSADALLGQSGVGGARISGLQGSADIDVAGTNDDEFNTTDTSDPMTGWTTLGTPTAHDMNSTVKSHYYVKKAAAAGTNWCGIYKASPATPFTVTAKLSDNSYRANYNSAALFVGEATPGKMLCLQRGFNSTAGAIPWELFTNPTTFSSTYVASWANFTGPIYLRIVVTSSTSIAAYVSGDGKVWTLIESGRNPGFTVGSAGLAVKSENGTYAAEAVFDWIRFT